MPYTMSVPQADYLNYQLCQLSWLVGLQTAPGDASSAPKLRRFSGDCCSMAACGAACRLFRRSRQRIGAACSVAGMQGRPSHGVHVYSLLATCSRMPFSSQRPDSFHLFRPPSISDMTCNGGGSLPSRTPQRLQDCARVQWTQNTYQVML